MNSNPTRRGFLRNALLGTLAVGMPPGAFAQGTLSKRLDWATFKTTRDYPSLMDAIKRMRANTNGADKRSWQYWANIHVNFCPHNVPYFIAWHRGYLRLFEKQLREVSGNPRLALPYWNYYADPTIPPEFTEAAGWNPLYVERINTNVSQALTLAPFSSTLTHFQREPTDSFANAIAFEPSLENQPHNPVHDLIGGVMTTMESPLDPIFWLHHANIDRLMSAWVAAGAGRGLPPATDAYWNGSFSYATRLTVPRASTMDSRLNLSYFYDNETLPNSIPPDPAATSQATGAESTVAPAGRPAGRVPALPPVGNFPATRMRATGPRRLALGGVSGIVLDNVSVSARVGLDKNAVQMVQDVMDSYQRPPFASAVAGARQYTSVKVVVTKVKMSKKGTAGGYYYKLYLNLPESPVAADLEENYLYGNLGPFRIVASQHHGHADMEVDIEFDVTGLLLKNRGRDLSKYSFSFVRVSGNNTPDGEVLSMGECRLELA
jgi:tyrosinase